VFEFVKLGNVGPTLGGADDVGVFVVHDRPLAQSQVHIPVRSKKGQHRAAPFAIGRASLLAFITLDSSGCAPQANECESFRCTK